MPTSDAINTGSSVFNTDSNVIGGSGSGAANSLISSLFGNSDSINSNSNTNTNSTNNTNVSGSINTNTSNTGTNTNNTTSGTNNTNSSTQTQGSLNPGANAGKSQLVFGSSPGIAGDVQIITGNKVTVLASNREVTNGRQTTGFYGYTAAPNLAPKAIYTNLCMLRPWASNFLSFIMPSNYLDSLCSSNGFTVGMPTPTIQITQPSTGSIVPKATTNTNTASSTQTNVPQYIGPLRAEIWATPPSVSSGARTSIFWNSNGAIACSLTSNDNAFTGSSLSGHASSQSLTKNTTFSISCQNATSTVSNQVVVTVQ